MYGDNTLWDDTWLLVRRKYKIKIKEKKEKKEEKRREWLGSQVEMRWGLTSLAGFWPYIGVCYV